MADLNAKIAQARRAGYSDDEILSHLSKDAALSGKLSQARQSGYAPREIVSYLGGGAKEKARRDAAKRAEGTPDAVRAMTKGFTFGFADELDAGSAALETATNNLFSRLSGKKGPGYSARDAYDAVMAENLFRDERYAKEMPIPNIAYQILGGAKAPGMGMAGRYIAGSKGFGEAALRSARAGAIAGGVAGAGNAKDGERLPKAIEGAGFGAGVGGGLPLAARAIGATNTRVAEAVKEVGTRLRLAAGGETATPSPRAMQRATTKATTYVDDLTRPTALERMTGRGVPEDALSANPIEAAGKPITAAEALGRRGMSQLKAVSRREGTTGEELESTLRQRLQEQPDRVLSDLQDVTGLNPEFVDGDFTAQAAALRRQAAPIYREAYAEPAVDSPELQALFSRPSLRKGLAKAASIAREEGRDPEELGLMGMDAFDGYRTAPAPPADVSPADLGALRTGAKAPTQGPSLLEFIGKNGGLADLGGELRSMDADTWHRAKPFLNRLLRPDGLGEEAMAQKAFEAGYFRDKVAGAMDSADNMQVVTAEDLRAAIRDEMAGKPRFARDPVDPARAERLDALERGLGEAGLNPRTAKMQDVRSALGQQDDDLRRLQAFADGDPPPMSETDIVGYGRPTMQTLDYIKRGLDDVVQEYRNPLTGRLELDTEGRAVVDTLQQFRNLIAPEGSKYAQALSAGGEPLRQEEAYRSAAKIMQNSTPYRLFRERIKNMGEAEREALKAGWVRDAFEAAQSGRLKLKDTQLPNYTRKVIDLIGREKGMDLVRRLRQEIEISQNARSMMPSQGSHTFDMLAADKDREAATAGFVGAAKSLMGGKLVQAAIQAITAPVAGAYRGAQAPLDQATRNEVGRLLQMSPSELDALLKARRAAAPAQNYRREALSTNLFARLPSTTEGK